MLRPRSAEDRPLVGGLSVRPPSLLIHDITIITVTTITIVTVTIIIISTTINPRLFIQVLMISSFQSSPKISYLTYSSLNEKLSLSFHFQLPYVVNDVNDIDDVDGDRVSLKQVMNSKYH